jgi:hypothetical protein
MAMSGANAWQQLSEGPGDGYKRSTLAAWWRDETKVWDLIERITRDETDWRAYGELVQVKRNQDLRYPIEFVEPRLKGYEAVREESGPLSERLNALSDELSSRYTATLVPGPAVSDYILAGIDGIDDPLTDKDLKRMCRARALLWRRLYAFLGSKEEQLSPRSLRGLSRAVRKLRRVELGRKTTAEEMIEQAKRILGV